MNEILAGLKKGAVPDRAEHCAKQVSNVMGYATGRFFVQQAFGGDSKDRASALIHSKPCLDQSFRPNTCIDVIDAFKESLPHLAWMDSKSSKAASEKVDLLSRQYIILLILPPNYRLAQSRSKLAILCSLIQSRHSPFGPTTRVLHPQSKAISGQFSTRGE